MSRQAREREKERERDVCYIIPHLLANYIHNMGLFGRRRERGEERDRQKDRDRERHREREIGIEIVIYLLT